MPDPGGKSFYHIFFMIQFFIFTATTFGSPFAVASMVKTSTSLKVSASAEGRFDFVPSLREVQILEDVGEGPFSIHLRFSVGMSLIGEILGCFSA